MENFKSLDQADRKILEEVQRDGRISVVDLAAKVNLTKTPCLNRLRKLEKQGFIRGYHADLDPQRIAQGHLVYVQIKLESTAREMLNEFSRAVRDIPEILACHMMAGGYDYLLKIRCRDMAAYRSLLGDVISFLPSVQQTSTFPVIEEVKDSGLYLIDHDQNR